MFFHSQSNHQECRRDNHFLFKIKTMFAMINVKNCIGTLGVYHTTTMHIQYKNLNKKFICWFCCWLWTLFTFSNSVMTIFDILINSYKRNVCYYLMYIYISMALCKTAVTPSLTHRRYCSFALSPWYTLTWTFILLRCCGSTQTAAMKFAL